MLHHHQNDPIRIGIVEDHSLVRETLKTYINQQTGFKVIFDADDGAVLLKELNRRFVPIDVLLLDLFCTRTDGRDTLKAISKLYPAIRTIIVSASTDLKIISTVFDFGAFGFISKTSQPEELCEAIISVANGNIHQNRFYQAHQRMSLNTIEIKVLELIWLEKTNEEIASIMCSSLSAIEKIKHQLKIKTDTKTTMGLIKYALERRIIVPGQE